MVYAINIDAFKGRRPVKGWNVAIAHLPWSQVRVLAGPPSPLEIIGLLRRERGIGIPWSIPLARVTGGELMMPMALPLRVSLASKVRLQCYRERVGIDAFTDEEVVAFRVGHDRTPELGYRLLVTVR